MGDLRKRFGTLVAAHRRRAKLTQEQLAERAGVSIDTISKIEIGATGARFPVLERLASALDVDVAELFLADAGASRLRSAERIALANRLALLSEGELHWIKRIIEAALMPRD